MRCSKLCQNLAAPPQAPGECRRAGGAIAALFIEDPGGCSPRPEPGGTPGGKRELRQRGSGEVLSLSCERKRSEESRESGGTAAECLGWDGWRDLQSHPVPPLPWRGHFGLSQGAPAWPWTPPGMGQPQLLWEFQRRNSWEELLPNFCSVGIQVAGRCCRRSKGSEEGTDPAWSGGRSARTVPR